MKTHCIGVLGGLALFVSGMASAQAPTSRAAAWPEPSSEQNRLTAPARAAVMKAYGQLPLSFEANQGQSDSRIKFLARGAGYGVFLAATEAVLVLPRGSGVVRMQLVSANASPRIIGLEPLPGRTHYIHGTQPAGWHSGVAQYARVRYEGVYPGVDLVYYGNQGRLEHDFLVAPGAHPATIRLRFEGAEKVEIDGRGDLVLRLPSGEIRLPKPRIHQSGRTAIEGGYVLKGKRDVGFEVGPYDRQRPLVIDPVLEYSTHLGGGTLDDFFNRSAIAVDASGSAYVTGQALAFPTTAGAYKTVAQGDEAFVAKLAPDGSSLVYATFIGGGFYDIGTDIAVDSAGQAYITGATYSRDFPTTPGAFKATNPHGCIEFNCPGAGFVSKLNADGSALVYSSYIGTTSADHGYRIAIDSNGSAYVAAPGLVAKVNAAGSGVAYSAAVVPGPDTGIAVDAAGSIHVVGGGCVTKLTPPGAEGGYSKCLGAGAWIRDIGLDAAGNAYVTGSTSSPNFPVTPDAFQTGLGSSSSAGFLTKLSPMGTLVYSTFLGGTDARGLAVDGSGSVYLTGTGGPPLVDPFQAYSAVSGVEAFVARLNPALPGAAGLVFSTALAGEGTDRGHDVAVDPSGNVYVCGRTRSTDFPTVNPLQTTLGGGFVAKIAPTAVSADLVLTMTASSPAIVGKELTYTITVTNTGPDATSTVDVMDHLPMASVAPLISVTSTQGSCPQDLVGRFPQHVTCSLGTLEPGGAATVTIVVRLDVKAAIRNRASVRSNVSDRDVENNSSFIDTSPVGFMPVCRGFTCTFDASSSSGQETIIGYAWDFGDGVSGSGPTASHTYVAEGSYTVTLTVTDSDGGTGRQSHTVSVPVNEPPTAEFTLSCSGLTCTFLASAADPDGAVESYAWEFGDGGSDSGQAVTYAYAYSDIYTVTLTVTDDDGATAVVSYDIYVESLPDDPPPDNTLPTATFTWACNGSSCTFDGSGSSDAEGPITAYAWAFGDGTTGSGAIVSHSYAAAGAYSASLAVTDTAGGIGTLSRIVTAVNTPPVASFASICGGLACAFDASASSDSDGTVVSYAWTFGDGSSGSGVGPSHAYTAAGTYTVVLTIADNAGAVSTHSRTVVTSQAHVGDLDAGRTTQSGHWTASVTVVIHTSGHGPVGQATVTGSWSSGGAGSCTTGVDGRCTISRSSIAKSTRSVTFRVANVTHAALPYRPADNHDPDGDGDGSGIIVRRD